MASPALLSVALGAQRGRSLKVYPDFSQAASILYQQLCPSQLRGVLWEAFDMESFHRSPIKVRPSFSISYDSGSCGRHRSQMYAEGSCEPSFDSIYDKISPLSSMRLMVKATCSS